MEVVFEGIRACKTVRAIAKSRGYPLWRSVEAQGARSSRHSLSSSILCRAHNKSFKPLASLTRTPSTPHLVAHGFAIVAQTVLRTGRRLTGRYVQEEELLR